MEKVRVCIGTITRNRKRGLQQLVDSYCRMSIPAHFELVFAVVENDSQSSVADIIRPLKKLGDLHYELEPQLGIPFARNHVLDISIRENCDFTTFVDDDETVTVGWLAALVENAQSRNLDLVGGPVRVRKYDDSASALNRCIWRGAVQRAVETALRGQNHFEKNREERAKIYTNNWMVKNQFLKNTEIRFDESLGFSGGSDSVFYHSAQLIGARTGWAPTADVYETLPLSRLTPKYQYERGRDQALASFRHRHEKITREVRMNTIMFIFEKTCLSAWLFFQAPFTRFNTLLMASRSFGLAIGELKGLIGSKSTHYEKVHKV